MCVHIFMGSVIFKRCIHSEGIVLNFKAGGLNWLEAYQGWLGDKIMVSDD